MAVPAGARICAGASVRSGGRERHIRIGTRSERGRDRDAAQDGRRSDISSGDFVGARTVLERAAEAGDASAAFAIASTYDPVVLARFKVRGLEPDIVKASFWYERARAMGSSEAPHRLQAMMASRSN